MWHTVINNRSSHGKKVCIVVVVFPGKKQYVCRLIRGMKNRYGAIEEVGVFSMNEKGLEAVPNPSALFLTNRDSSPGVSSAVTVQMEGTRPLLLEVQALCSPVQVHSASRCSIIPTILIVIKTKLTI